MPDEIITDGSSIYSMSIAHTRDLWETSKDWLIEETLRRYGHDLIRSHVRVPRSMAVRIFAFKDPEEVFAWNTAYREALVVQHRLPKDRPDLEKVLAATRAREVIIEVTAVTEPLRIATMREGSLA